MNVIHCTGPTNCIRQSASLRVLQLPRNTNTVHGLRRREANGPVASITERRWKEGRTQRRTQPLFFFFLFFRSRVRVSACVRARAHVPLRRALRYRALAERPRQRPKKRRKVSRGHARLCEISRGLTPASAKSFSAKASSVRGGRGGGGVSWSATTTVKS